METALQTAQLAHCSPSLSTTPAPSYILCTTNLTIEPIISTLLDLLVRRGLHYAIWVGKQSLGPAWVNSDAVKGENCTQTEVRSVGVGLSQGLTEHQNGLVSPGSSSRRLID